VTGTLVLDELFRDQPLDFFVSFSSLSAQMPAFGQLAYAAANNFLENYTARRLGDGRTFTACISWDVWQGDGMAYHAAGPSALRALKEADFERRGILPAEGAAVFGWVLEGDVPHVLVSTSDYLAVAEASAHDFAQVYLEELRTAAAASRHHRPDLPTPYVRPRGDTEVTVGAIWEELLGIAAIGVDDDFFALGGDSLIGTQLMTRIKRACGVKLSTKALYDRRTIRSLCEAIDEAVVAQTSDEAFRMALEQVEQLK
jgi:acyl carrier protein